jgi:hypothetical protein
MKSFKIVLIMLLVFCFNSASVLAQGKEVAAAVQKSGGSLPMGFGATFIDGQTYYLISLTPEVSFGNLGVGLDLNLRFSTQGKIRAGDYEKFEDYLRIIRYVRWAQKGEPFYIRVGQLDYSLLGHGSIIYNYRNSASYDLRKTGIELDLNFEKYGFESMYSDLTGRGLLGLRGYVKPLKLTSLAKIPVINNFEVGATYARDLNLQADWAKPVLSNGTLGNTDSTRTGLSIYGFDLGLPLISYPIFKTALYFDYAQIANYGHGTTMGINMNFSGLGLLNIRGKYELRFNGDQFLPAYFNALYERDRFDPVQRISKTQLLKAVTASKGYYGEVILSVLGTFNVIAGYQSPFDAMNEGILHAELQLPEVAGIVLRGAFDKTHIGRVFILDNFSILSAEIGYKPMPYLMVSTLYQRTFSDRDASGNPLGYFVAQDRVEPKVSLIIDF